eukprot:scaffold66702_cov62-Phaeocystis_antarctica.AAC.4
MVIRTGNGMWNFCVASGGVVVEPCYSQTIARATSLTSRISPQSYIRKNTDVGVGEAVVKAGWDAARHSAWRRAVGSALPLALSASTVGLVRVATLMTGRASDGFHPKRARGLRSVSSAPGSTAKLKVAPNVVRSRPLSITA